VWGCVGACPVMQGAGGGAEKGRGVSSTHRNRLAVMHRLAVHNVKTANCAFLAQFAVQRGGDIVSHWFY
jgi:hypothetical protein